MIKQPLHIIICLFLGIFLGACSSSESHKDLREFIDENKRRPPGIVQEAPKIEPYEAFEYNAYRLRSPFDRPVSVKLQQQLTAASNSNVKPIPGRKKQRLEQYDLSTLNMVGTLRKDGALWALISDPDGSIERVRRGDYMGKNHGRITGLSDNKIDLIEIVASGTGWLERPNVLELKTADSK